MSATVEQMTDKIKLLKFPIVCEILRVFALTENPLYTQTPTVKWIYNMHFTTHMDHPF